MINFIFGDEGLYGLTSTYPNNIFYILFNQNGVFIGPDYLEKVIIFFLGFIFGAFVIWVSKKLGKK